MYAVRPNHSIKLGGCPVGKIEADTIASNQRQTRKLVIELQNAFRYEPSQSGVKVSAMRQQIWCSPPLFGGLTEDHVETDLASIEILVIPRSWIEGCPAQHRLQTKHPQNFHGIAANLDASAHAHEARSLFVDGDVYTGTPECRRCGETAHPSSDNRNGKSSH